MRAEPLLCASTSSRSSWLLPSTTWASSTAICATPGRLNDRFSPTFIDSSRSAAHAAVVRRQKTTATVLRIMLLQKSLLKPAAIHSRVGAASENISGRRKAGNGVHAGGCLTHVPISAEAEDPDVGRVGALLHGRADGAQARLRVAAVAQRHLHVGRALAGVGALVAV